MYVKVFKDFSEESSVQTAVWGELYDAAKPQRFALLREGHRAV